MARERPWRHVRAGFWSSLAWRLHISWNSGSTAQGRSREEMIADAIIAQTRRQEEVALECEERRATIARREQGFQRGSANWWEVDNGMDKEEPVG